MLLGEQRPEQLGHALGRHVALGDRAELAVERGQALGERVIAQRRPDGRILRRRRAQLVDRGGLLADLGEALLGAARAPGERVHDERLPGDVDQRHARAEDDDPLAQRQRVHALDERTHAADDTLKRDHG